MENKMDELLNKLNACKAAKEWAKGKTFEEIYNTCHRGDWLNWLFAKTNPEDVQLLTLVKGHQANTVRHLMKDERSIKAVDTAIAFGEGRATEKDSRNAAYAAYIAADGAASYSSIYAARAAYHAVNAADSAAYAAYNSAAGDSDAYTAAKQANLQQTADIFRKYISIDKFKI